MPDSALHVLGASFASLEAVWSGAHSGVAAARTRQGEARRLRWVSAELLDKHGKLESEVRDRVASIPHADLLVQCDDIITIDGYLCLLAAAPAAPPLQVLDRRWAPAEALELARDVAMALAVLHGNDVVHGTLAPPSIHVGNAQAVLADAGLRIEDEDLARKLGCWAAPARYVSPEQAQGGLGDAASDVYALGCILFELLTGKPVADGATTAMVLYQKLYEPGLPAAIDEAPAPVRALIEQLLAKDPTLRPANGEAARVVIEAALQEAPRHVSGPRPVVVPDLASGARSAAVVDGTAHTVRTETEPEEETVLDGTVVEMPGRLPDTIGGPDEGVPPASPTPLSPAPPGVPAFLQQHGKQIAMVVGAAILGAAVMWMFGGGEPAATPPGAASPSEPVAAINAGTTTGQASENTDPRAALPARAPGQATTGGPASKQVSTPQPQTERLEQPAAASGQTTVDPPAAATDPPTPVQAEPEVVAEATAPAQVPVRKNAPRVAGRRGVGAQATPPSDPPNTVAAADPPVVAEPPTDPVTDPQTVADPPVGGDPDPMVNPAIRALNPPVDLSDPVVDPTVGDPAAAQPAAGDLDEAAITRIPVVGDPDLVKAGDLVPLMPEVVRPELRDWERITFTHAALRQIELSDRKVTTFLLIDEHGAVLAGRVLRVDPDITADTVREALYREIIAQMKSWSFSPPTFRNMGVKVWIRVDVENVFGR